MLPVHVRDEPEGAAYQLADVPKEFPLRPDFRTGKESWNGTSWAGPTQVGRLRKATLGTGQGKSFPGPLQQGSLEYQRHPCIRGENRSRTFPRPRRQHAPQQHSRLVHAGVQQTVEQEGAEQLVFVLGSEGAKLSPRPKDASKVSADGVATRGPSPCRHLPPVELSPRRTSWLRSRLAQWRCRRGAPSGHAPASPLPEQHSVLRPAIARWCLQWKPRRPPGLKNKRDDGDASSPRKPSSTTRILSSRHDTDLVFR